MRGVHDHAVFVMGMADLVAQMRMRIQNLDLAT